ncbi:NAD-dependent epimerase/dehydratase family protein [Castellaniella sp.]|uniref:UDP-2-acetamido-2,6-beta-L-arabino-hexul-4-ose reductase n=1 Tax=Castellaniella sp. TaxID=1955812 RepID=UPI00356A0F85
MRILITGADGFIGRNLRQHLSTRADIELVCHTRAQGYQALPALLAGVDVVFHLAGVNRPQDPAEFTAGNVGLTRQLLAAAEAEMRRTGRSIEVVYTSSTQAQRDNPYGASKRAAEALMHEYATRTQAPVHVFRLPNVFGKWSRPDYNSAVATFCYRVARGQAIEVHDPDAALSLVYVDDVIAAFLALIDGATLPTDADGFAQVQPVYPTTVGAVAAAIRSFAASRQSLITERVGSGLLRALYATYVSFLPPASFAYDLVQHADPRGTFVEMLKTPDCGQFSFFTAHPGVTRGGHYHHSKTEKFLVIRGQARFRFRHILTGEAHELVTSGARPQVVETVPGWTHDITNVGSDELVVMLWANEIFDPTRPDTYACPL